MEINDDENLENKFCPDMPPNDPMWEIIDERKD
jgi:hypothetical protein